MLLRTLYGLAAVGVLILMPTSVLAQRADARVGQASPGWIGISIDVRTQTSSDGGRATVVITDVNDRSPARAAGLRTGDVILRINDIRDVRGFENVASRLHLDPGDPVHIVYVRDGRRHEINLTAGDRSRPASTPFYTFRFQPDSMVEAAFRTMNSLRVRLMQARSHNVPLDDPALDPPDPVIARIRAREVLEAQVREPKAEFRPLAPYLLGQNRAVGAEVIDLRPELAAYFQVEDGVLVTDVPNNTPAAEAGINPGDVITRIDDIAVRSVQGLRLALSRAEATIPLTLVRQGATMTVILRR